MAGQGGSKPSAPRGRFITVEGIEGVGKSTQIEAIRTFLQARGLAVVTTREPGGTAVAEAIREILLDPLHRGMADDAELMLIFAARADHLARVISPALARGDWVICDRFTDATYAYQGGGRGVPASRIGTLEDWVQRALRPDLCLVLDLPVEEGLERVDARGARDRFEREEPGFFERVRDTYLARARSDPTRYRVIDTRGGRADITAAIEQTLAAML